jgi:hypothetical protein
MTEDVTLSVELSNEEYENLIACVEEVLRDKRNFHDKLTMLEDKIAEEKNSIEASIILTKTVLKKIMPRTH